MLVDANILLFAVDDESPFHRSASDWLTARLNGPRRVGLAWPTLIAFLRIATNPRAFRDPLSPPEAWGHVRAWLACPPVWIPAPTERHADVLGALLDRYRVHSALVSDAHLAALAIEHGLTVCSADTDFARFAEIRWLNPIGITPPA
jgi:hypothetical protein